MVAVALRARPVRTDEPDITSNCPAPTAAVLRAAPRLRVVSGAVAGDSLLLSIGECVIGRGDAADLVLPDRGVSRAHAKIIRSRRGTVSVIDLGSTNGLLVNGAPVDLATLHPGDELNLGPIAVLRLDWGRVGQEARQRPAEAARILAVLSPAERRVARGVVAGQSNPQIAAQLGISRRTVETHLTHIYAKLEIRSRTQLLRRWLSAGVEPGAVSAR